LTRPLSSAELGVGVERNSLVSLELADCLLVLKADDVTIPEREEVTAVAVKKEEEEVAEEPIMEEVVVVLRLRLRSWRVSPRGDTTSRGEVGVEEEEEEGSSPLVLAMVLALMASTLSLLSSRSMRRRSSRILSILPLFL